MRKILVARNYIMLKSGNLEFFIGRRYFRMLKAAMEEAEKMKDGTSRVIDLEFKIYTPSVSSSFLQSSFSSTS